MKSKLLTTCGVFYVLFAFGLALAENHWPGSLNAAGTQEGRENRLALKDRAGNSLGEQLSGPSRHSAHRIPSPGIGGEAFSAFIQETRTKKFQPNCLIMFTADWCSSCRKMYPILNKLKNQGYTVYTLDFDTHEALAKKWHITKLPTIIIRTNQLEVKRFVDCVTAPKIKIYLRKNEVPDYDVT